MFNIGTKIVRSNCQLPHQLKVKRTRLWALRNHWSRNAPSQFVVKLCIIFVSTEHQMPHKNIHIFTKSLSRSHRHHVLY